LIDVRFPTALQIMLSLALADRNAISQLSSAELAKSLGANPSFVRKLLVPLVQSKLLRSQMGKTGGVHLARPAAEINLRDIYSAVVADSKIWAPRTGIPKRCLVSSNVQGYFEELIDDAQDAILSLLGQRTLLEVLTELEIRENGKHQEPLMQNARGSRKPLRPGASDPNFGRTRAPASLSKQRSSL
jgi:Rrf2 family transcriptional repressor of oqxAB